MKINYFSLFFIFFISNLVALGQTNYLLSPEPIDVVIPCCSKDLGTLELCIQGIRQYGQNIRKIIVISKERLTSSAEWFDESLYPFSKKEIALEIFHQDVEKAEKFLEDPKTRIGWIYQQFLKLYAPFIIPEISSNVLVLDADVVFLNPIEFMTETGEPFFAVSNENHEFYFQHMAYLLPGLKRVYEEHSGIVHHMLFQKSILSDLHEMVYFHHGEELWKAICHTIDLERVYASPFSEYEIYFNFSLLRTEQAHIRYVKWSDSPTTKQKDLKNYQNLGYIYVACHLWGLESH
jgi:lipopolysaccharide biosynthesis glycosyltransferase